MKALSLFAVFAVARMAILAGREIAWSEWSLAVYLWQDAVVALLFGAVESASRNARWTWALYGIAVVYVAINVPLIRILSTPMTPAMFGAARGALSDSIRHYATLETALTFGLIIGAGALFPVLFRRLPLHFVRIATVVGLTLAATGLIAAPRVETNGFNRNALFTLVSSTLPRIHAQPMEAEWRRSPFDARRSTPLADLRGAASGRNVVVIVLESTGAAYLRTYGAAVDPMPHLTEFASRAVVFEHAYSVYPESIKALVPLLCSRFPAFDTNVERHASIRTPSIAQVLKENRYRTALFHSGRFIYLGMQSMIENRGFDLTEDAGAIGGNVNSSFGVDEPATIARILEWIDGVTADERFFVVYVPIAGHHPYETPQPRPFPEHDEIDRYRNALFFGDAALGVFFEELKKRGLYDRTIFVVFGDHGEAFGQHDGNHGHTMFLYEENVRIPYLVALPGLDAARKRIARVASVIDTAPTILDLLGLPIPAAFQGSSLLDDSERMALFFADYSLPLAGLCDGPWKFIDEVGASHPKLFRLDCDPAERENIASKYPVRTEAYRKILTSWTRAQKELILHKH